MFTDFEIYIFFFVLLMVAFYTILECKIIAYMQIRRGPNIVGPFGLLQAIADGLKLLVKKTIYSQNANTVILIAGPQTLKFKHYKQKLNHIQTRALSSQPSNNIISLNISNTIQIFSLLTNFILLGFVLYLQNSITILQQENARLVEALATVTSELAEIKKILNLNDVSSQLVAVDKSVHVLYSTITLGVVVFFLGLVFFWLDGISKGNNLDGLDNVIKDNTQNIMAHVDKTAAATETHILDGLHAVNVDLAGRFAKGTVGVGEQLSKGQSTILECLIQKNKMELFTGATLPPELAHYMVPQ